MLLRATTAHRVRLVVSLAHVPIVPSLGGGAWAVGETLSTGSRHGRPLLQTVLLRLAAWCATLMMRRQATGASTALELCVQPLVLGLLGRWP